MLSFNKHRAVFNFIIEKPDTLEIILANQDTRQLWDDKQIIQSEIEENKSTQVIFRLF